MAPGNKLLARDASGRPMIARVADAALASRARDVIVVTGHQAALVEMALNGRAVRLVHAAEYAHGLAASLRAGILAVPESARAALICLGDMPLVTAVLLDRLIEAGEDRLIVVPTCRGQRGNPVLWDRRFFAEIAALTGDSGARALLARHAGLVVEHEVDDTAVLLDFDTPETLAGYGEDAR